MLIWLGNLFVYIHGLEGCLIIAYVFMNCCGLLFSFIMARGLLNRFAPAVTC